MKLFKWLGIGIGTLVALSAIAVAVISATFDPNKYKDQITQYVKESQQRTLLIPGRLSLAFFPRLGIQAGELSLSESKSDKIFIKLSGAKLFVELLPLLSRWLCEQWQSPFEGCGTPSCGRGLSLTERRSGRPLEA